MKIAIRAFLAVFLGGILGFVMFACYSYFSPEISNFKPESFQWKTIGNDPGAETTVPGTAVRPAASKIRQTPTQTLTPFQPVAYNVTTMATQTPTHTPVPSKTMTPVATVTPEVPSHALIRTISGRFPAYSLDCEARVAVDWAAYYGVTISEFDFQSRLPLSDNPEKGFVGNVHGVWGQIPPKPYGVYAKPVAKLLRAYGIPAKTKYGMTVRGLKKEIATGNPVIVWVVGRVVRGTPLSYTSRDGIKTRVVRYEHTVIVIGYTETKVTFLDGGWVYSRRWDVFLDSWGVLGNMAIVHGK